MPRAARLTGEPRPDREALRHRRPAWIGRTDDNGQVGFTFSGTADSALDTEAIGGVPAEDVLPDGLPPASSPDPTVYGGIGFLLVKWDGVVNHDPVTYEVHVSDTTGFTPDADTLAAETPATSKTLTTLPDGTDLIQGTVYFVKIVAKDVDGSAAPSAEDSSACALVDSDDIAANSILASHILAGEIDASKLAAELILASVIKTASSGQRLELSSADGLRNFAPDDTVLVKLPTTPGEYPEIVGFLKATGVQLDAGDGPYWGGGSVPIEFLSSSGQRVGVIQMDDGGDGSQADGAITAFHPTNAVSKIQAANDDVSPTYSVGLNVSAGAASEDIFLFGQHMGFLKLLDEAGDSDFATSLGFWDGGVVAAGVAHQEFIQFPVNSVWLLFARSTGPNEEIANTYLVTSGPGVLNPGIVTLAAYDFNLGSITIQTGTGGAQWGFAGGAANVVALNYQAGGSGSSTWSWKAMRLGNIGTF